VGWGQLERKATVSPMPEAATLSLAAVGAPDRKAMQTVAFQTEDES
jgi:hypothetical protein